MKRRAGYVSNSSSSSFIILNWSGLDDQKKDMVLNYAKHVRELWESNGLPVVESKYEQAHVDFGKANPSARDLDFGWLDENWRFREKDGCLEMTTEMGNFEMGRWLDHIGGIDYRFTGENWGFFDDEKVEIDESVLETLKGIGVAK